MARKKDTKENNGSELREAIEALEKEKHLDRNILFDAIENALLSACRNQYGKVDNIHVVTDREACTYSVYADKEVVGTPDDVEDKLLQISLDDALRITPDAEIGQTVKVPINSMNLGRIATTNAKNVITQKIREEERSEVLNYYMELQHHVVTGVVQRKSGDSYSINLGRADGLLPANEQGPGEYLHTTDRIKVYIVEVRSGQRDSRGSGNPRILVSRTHPELVKCLFEEEVQEISDGTVEIQSIAREAGSRTKIAVWSHNPNVDPVGACVGLNGSRVNQIVSELNGEKIDIVNYDENPGNFIQNALSPAKIVAVFADPEARTAKVVVPDYQLSLAIGREGQNARLAAKLTGYKIDIKSETQAKDAPGFRYEDYADDVTYVDEEGNPVDENGNPIDFDGETEYVDENGNPVDENGNPIDAGEVEYVDENGNPVDENGNPLTSEDGSEDAGTGSSTEVEGENPEAGNEETAGEQDAAVSGDGGAEAADGDGDAESTADAPVQETPEA